MVFVFQDQAVLFVEVQCDQLGYEGETRVLSGLIGHGYQLFFLHCGQRSDNLREGTFLLARSQFQRVHCHHDESIVNIYVYIIVDLPQRRMLVLVPGFLLFPFYSICTPSPATHTLMDLPCFVNPLETCPRHTKRYCLGLPYRGK